MINFSNFVQKAQQLIDPSAGLNLGLNRSNNSDPDVNPDKATLFQAQFRLPASQSPNYEINAELIIPPSNATQGDKDHDRGYRYAGKLHLSQGFIAFSTTPSSFVQSSTLATSQLFTGQTHGGGPGGNGFTFPLCAIRRVERLNSHQFQFALAITTWNGFMLETSKAAPGPDDREQRFTIYLAGTRTACERFCDGLKRGLRAGVVNVAKMKRVAAECYSEYLLLPADKKPSSPPDAGLGLMFRYPGDAKKLRDRAKMRLWTEYLRDNGRNITLIRQPTFHKLIRVGLPNRLRGEIWELTSGSLYLRLENPSLYIDTLEKHAGKESLAIDEIEKDLNRSLPEYPGFQSPEGIGRLRRVLTAYSWVNADVGYCQAMNIVVAALLIYMSETQAFFLLSTLCDRLVPGYYSTTMYGTLLDQKVFESLVERTMPILWEHLVKSDVQLSVVSLPWFLSLYINSMPLVFAFRVLDVFFVEGPKVLFQVGLAILRINGEELLDAADDGAFISVLKSYFTRLDESAHPKSDNPKLRAVTRFQELMVVAFKEFSEITHRSITELRLKNKDAVLNNIENFAKRTALRNLGPDSKLMAPEELGALYDRFYTILYERQQRDHILLEEQRRRGGFNAGRPGGKGRASDSFSISSNDHSIAKGRVGLGPSTSEMDYDGFREFLANMTKWAIVDNPSTPRRETYSDREKGMFGATRKSDASVYIGPWGAGPEPADHEFMQRLFARWDSDSKGFLTLQDVVLGLARLKGKRDIMGTITYFFELYDDDSDGRVDREGILRMSEALLFLSRRGLDGTLSPAAQNNSPPPESMAAPAGSVPGIVIPGQSNNEKFLGSVSAFIRRCFEYADPDHPQNVAAREAELARQKEQRGQGGSTTASSGDTNDLIDPDAFAIGDDSEDEFSERESPVAADKMPEIDLLTMDDSPPGSPRPAKAGLSSPSKPKRKTDRSASSQAANAALDPSNPLHITLPTFRMVVLADEMLEQFFESSLPASFHIIDGLSPAVTSASSSTLTTFSSLGVTFTGAARAAASAATGSSAAAAVGPNINLNQAGRGLRGVLDNIVTNGMQVASEVQRRIEEAQKEMERAAAAGTHASGPSAATAGLAGRPAAVGAATAHDEDDEDDDDDAQGRDLLDGADAQAGGGAGGVESEQLVDFGEEVGQSKVLEFSS
ncbi:putative GTPase-activating protein AN11010 [Ceratocystis fimbriata CBS 114723]|uniref:Putative GTPase-activating protein AN11010 n=1 Tax=Ceratocystis fimbriata CBS 114723 TaxID=1035309 RepID=A0A2C5X3B5_9PEZI|nr:putative GTPase-activating protein AN11010 [Ceratocystis fimbriata CBS 114723]